MLLDYKLSQGSIVLRVPILDSSVTTGAGLTGLTFSSTGMRIGVIADNEASATAYTVAGSTIETITTLGTYAAPTATKCRFKEVDATNFPGLYELQIADARFAVSSAKSVTIFITGATNAAPCRVLIPLRSVDPYDGVRFGLTALPNAVAGANGGVPLGDANSRTDVGKVLGTIQTAGDLAALINAASSLASSANTNASSANSNITSLLAKFTGMTSLARWLQNILRKANPDPTATTEINATNGVGVGTFDPTEDALEAIRDRGDIAWISGGGGGGGTVNVGNTTVTSDTSGSGGATTAGNLAVKAFGIGIGGAQVVAYIATEYITNPGSATPRGFAVTKADGSWTNMRIDSGLTYSIIARGPDGVTYGPVSLTI
jgi:hypothetical protein